MNNLQKTVTLTTCIIYNWHKTDSHPILLLTLANPLKPPLYNHILSLREIGNTKHIQLLATLQSQTHSNMQAPSAQFTLDLDQLSQKKSQYFTTSLNDCIVRINTQPNNVGGQPSSRVTQSSKIIKKGSEETQQFIRARQEFLNKLKNKFESHCQEKHQLGLSKMPTPYFVKEHRNQPQQLTSKIYKLLNQTRNLQQQSLNLYNVKKSILTIQDPNKYHERGFLLYNQPQIYQQQQILQPRAPPQSKPTFHQHYHRHNEIHSNHYSLRRSKSIDELLPCRTNDSESAVSSQQDYYHSLRPPFNPQLAFNAKYPFGAYPY